MAGAWHPIDLDVEDQREFHHIIELTDADIDTTLGRLTRFWLWVNKATEDAFIPGITVKTLCRRFGGDVVFWNAVAIAGWLIIKDDGIVIPGYEKRFSNSAKARLTAAKRQEKCRENKTSHADVTETCDKSVTAPLPKEDNIREDKKEDKKTKEAAVPLEVSFPPSMDTPECRAALDRWIAYRAERKPKITQATIAAIPKAWDARGPTRFIAAVDYSISQGWQGIYEARDNGNTQREQATGARLRAEPGKYSGLKVRGSVPAHAANTARDPPGQVNDSWGLNAPNAEPLAGSG